VVSGHRKKRPWRTGRCPFCPRQSGIRNQEVFALPNKFPALTIDAPIVSEKSPYRKSRAQGVCEVIVESRRHEGDFHNFTLEGVSRYIQFLGQRSVELGSMPFIRQVMPFKNKGTTIGVSMTHPHSQIYATPFVPPRIRKEITAARRYEARRRQNLFDAILEREIKDQIRVVYRNQRFVLFVPTFAMWPYEMHVYGSRPVRGLGELDSEGALMLADTIRVATATYERHFGRDYAYMMIFHQAPSRGEVPSYRLHVEFYCPQMARGRMKYAAGIEWGAGTFTYDGSPEERASELRATAAKAVKDIKHLGRPEGRSK